MSRNHQPVTSSWTQVLSCSNLGYWCAVVRQVHWSLPEEAMYRVVRKITPNRITLNYIKFKVKKCRRTSNTLQALQLFRNYGNDANNKWDFSLGLKVCWEFDYVISAGKLFRVRAAATGNTRSPIVDSRAELSVIINLNYAELSINRINPTPTCQCDSIFNQSVLSIKEAQAYYKKRC